MCEVLDRVENRGIAKGIEQGIAKGIEKGRNQRDREKIEEMLKAGRTAEKIADFCGYPLELVKLVEESI